MNATPYNVAIVDDEPDGRNLLALLVQQCLPELRLTGTAACVAAGIALVRDHQPDILFLDVEMPDGNAFDLLSACSHWKGQVILVTAYDHYAIKAIKASVSDYLLKPVDEAELIQAVNKAIQKIKQPGTAGSGASLLDMYRQLMMRKVRIPTLNGFSLVHADDIIRCEASGNYTILVFANGKRVTASRKLGEYEDELTPLGFVRVHNKHLVNLAHIVEYNKGKIGGGYLIVAGHDMVEVSARKKTDLLKLLGA